MYLIPILVPIFGMMFVLGMIFLDYRKRRDMLTLHHQERMAAIDKGVELPPIPEDFFKEDCDGGKARSPHSDFGWALFWLLAGLATLVALYFNFNSKIALYALIPLAIGLHHLIYYYAVGKKEAMALEAERRAKAGQVDRVPVS
ncbi:MAG: hypothetical protein KJ072_25560 [Verrucomicrobia bacterium]|nr:hypothetical protein [Verrucomicrobiota bacterium]